MALPRSWTKPSPLAAAAMHGSPVDDDKDHDGRDDERAEVDDQADTRTKEGDQPATESEAQRLVDLLRYGAQPDRPRVERSVVRRGR